MGHSMTTARLAAGALALTLLAAACGSTVERAPLGGTGDVAFEEGGSDELELSDEDLALSDEDLALGGDSELTLDDDFDSGTAPAPGAGGAGAATAPSAQQGGSATGSAGEASDGGPAAPSGSEAAAGDSRAAAPGANGLDDDRMYIALAYTEDGAEANAAIGAAGVTQGDPRRQYETMIDWVNAQGGVAGRELVPVWHRYRVASGESFSAQDQAACTTYTQDNEVFVSLASGAGGDDNFLACMENAGVPILATSRIDDDDTFRRFPRYNALLGLSNDMIARVWPGGLDEGGYFEETSALEDVKIGLVTYDMPAFRNPVERNLRPAMRAVGQEFEDEVYIRPPDNINDVGQMAAEMGSAILRFRQQGIEHVMIFDASNALITLLFMQAAENQGYRPRYGLNSSNGGQVMADLVPDGQLRDAVSVGWNPTFDVPEGDFTDWSPARALCDRIYEEANISFDNTNAQIVGYIQCDQVRGLMESVNASQGPLSADSVNQGLARLGSSFDSAAYIATRFAPDRRFGLARYRLAAYFDDCACFKYTSGWRNMP